jgi:transcription antitermination factor NusG
MPNSAEAKFFTGPRWDSEGEALPAIAETRFASAGSPLPAAGGPPRWYVVQTRARHEKRIGTDLQQKGIDAFVPTVRQAHQWSDRTKQVEVPLFSCYVFVRMVASPALCLHVLNTMGVFRFVCVSGEPAPIPDSQMESMQAVLAYNLPVSHCGFIQVGQRVRIRGGALDGVEGILTAARGAQRFVISIDLLQQSIAVVVGGYALEPV